MSISQDPAPVATSGGERCRKCGEPMQRLQHSPGWRPLPGRNFFRFWDHCKPCGRIQHYEAARVIAADDVADDLQETPEPLVVVDPNV